MTDVANPPTEDATDDERCRVAALRILEYRFNSVVELRRKLAAKKFERETISRTIERLNREKWLDDERFADAFVRMRASKDIGSLRIRRELRAAGVAEETASRAVRANIDGEREQDSAVALCKRKMRIIARRHGAGYLRTDAGRKKLAAYLLSRGYEAGRILEIIDQCLKASGE